MWMRQLLSKGRHEVSNRPQSEDHRQSLPSSARSQEARFSARGARWLACEQVTEYFSRTLFEEKKFRSHYEN
jgi:hypothetical protein